MVTDVSQCDSAMIAKLKGLEIDGKEVPVIYIDPEKEFVTSSYPTIAIYRIGMYPDDYRWTNDLFYDNLKYSIDGVLDTIDEREAPAPYNLYYGIRIFYEYMQDGATLNTFLSYRLKRGAYIEIGGDYYDINFVSYRNPESTYKDFGEQKEKERREFIEQYMYRLDIELDLASRTTKKVSKELIINSGVK